MRKRIDDGILDQVSGVQHRPETPGQSPAGPAPQARQIAGEQLIQRVVVASLGFQQQVHRGIDIYFRHGGWAGPLDQYATVGRPEPRETIYSPANKPIAPHYSRACVACHPFRRPWIETTIDGPG